MYNMVHQRRHESPTPDGHGAVGCEGQILLHARQNLRLQPQRGDPLFIVMFMMVVVIGVREIYHDPNALEEGQL
jgi:hypothetical protein